MTVCDAVHVIDMPGGSVVGVAGQVTVSLLSVTENGPGRVTLPVFVTR